MVHGKVGFVAWFYGIIYVRLRKSCKNIYVKIVMHSIGVISMVVGLFYLITTMPSIISILGMFLVLVGLVVFFIPLGVD